MNFARDTMRRSTGVSLILPIALAGLAMLAAAFRIPAAAVWREGLTAGLRTIQELMYYNVTFLAANYSSAGFVRRGLGGTIAMLLARDPNTGGLLFHILSAVVVSIAFLILGWRLAKAAPRLTTAFMLLFCVVSPQLFQGWSSDIARTDMAVIACIAFAAIVLDDDHPVAAALLLLVGFMIHETAIIFGVPLLFAIAVTRDGKGLAGARRLLPHGIGLIVAVVIVAAVQGALTLPVDVFVRSMVAHTPAPESAWYRDLRDCAIYMMVTGMRGLKTAICYNVYYRAYPLMIAFSVLVTVINGLILGLERRWLLFLVAILGPTLFMDAVANDLGRWVKFACVSSWILSVLLQKRGEVTLGGMRLLMSVLLLGVLLSMGSSRVHTVNRTSETVAQALGYGAPPEIGDWMTHCDPDWRSVIATATPS